MATIEQLKGGSRAPNAVAVFIHGLQGDKFNTWKSSDLNESFWPKWLIDDLPGMRVLTVGYESSATNWAGSSMALTDRAANIAEQMVDHKLLHSYPIILIAHSLGGLLIKQILRYLESRQNTDERYKKIIENVMLVVFLATPHSGSRLATRGNRFRLIFRPSIISEDLVFADHHLRELNQWYRSFSNGKFKQIVFIETKDAQYVGRIVDEVSSDPGISNARMVPIDADHSAICKPLNRESEVYKIIKSEIQYILEQRLVKLTDALNVRSEIAQTIEPNNTRFTGASRLTKHKGVLEGISSQKAFRILLCGPSISLADQSAGAKLKLELRDSFELEGFEVVMGENDGLSNNDFQKHDNAIVGEFEFVKSSCNAVVVIAETIGAWCELSLFSWQIANDAKSRTRGVDLIVLISEEHSNGNDFFRAGPYALVNAYGFAEFVDLSVYNSDKLLERLRGRRLIYSSKPSRKPRRTQ